LKKIGIPYIIIIVVGILLLYVQPIYFNYPIYYDSGVFSYVGSIINNSKLPYIDAWDHKGLWIYFYNAIGLKLWNGEIRGVYILEYLSVVFSLLISIKLITKDNKLNPKIIQIYLISLIGSYALFFEGGNLPETIVFPWQLLFYTLAFCVLNGNGVPSRYSLFFLALLAGAAIFVALLTRPNNAIGIIVLTVFLFFKHDSFFKTCFLLISFLILTSVSYYVISHNLQYEMKVNYIDFNLYYSHMDFFKRCKNALIFTSLLLLSPIGIVTIIAVASTIYSFTSKIKVPSIRFLILNKNAIFLFVLIVDFLSQMVSGRVGRGYLHYTIIVLPALFVVLLVIGYFRGTALAKEDEPSVKVISFQVASFIFSGLAIFYFNYSAYVNFYHLTTVKNELISSIQKHTVDTDKIYVSWADAWIYVASRRYSFTRFIYPTPIFLSAFDGRDRLAILMNDYNKSPPEILVDWNKELFVKDISIQYLNVRFMKDYTVIESNSFYSIYKLKMAR
jgi:hypothetical protein